MTEPWVLSQQRTMARWVASKTKREIADISTDLCDGIVLVELINKIVEETKAVSYGPTLLYTKPKFTLQKMENVDDVLKFCRLVLQMNTCNISAEDVVGGNTKLILGLIWSLFIFSSAKMVALKSESKSLCEIKAILLHWLNVVGKSKALPVLHNFNKDWSIQQENRPDLVFAAILDFYVPKLVDYKRIQAGRRLAGLQQIIALADSSLGIPDLAVADDFNVLVPDEKCILFYVLEWYMFFEVRKTDVPVDLILGCRNVSETSTSDLSPFFSTILRAVKLKNKYDTKSLRLLNQLNTHLAKVDERLKSLGSLATSNLEKAIDLFCSRIDKSRGLQHELNEREECGPIKVPVSCLKSILEESIGFKLDVKPAIVYSDFPELQNLSKSLDSELKNVGIPTSYEPLKALSLESLLEKLSLLLKRENELSAQIDSFLEVIFETNVRDIGLLIKFMVESLPSANKNTSQAAKSYVSGLETLLTLKHKTQEYQSVIKQEHTTSDLRVLADSIAFYDLPLTPQTPEESLFFLFRDEVKNEVNQANLTFSDVRKFLSKWMSPSQLSGPELSEFIRLIPVRTYLPRSESHELGINYHSDDSDDSDAIFERVSRTLESKLAGAHDKIYDLSMLVTRMESGFHL
ncbi:hypothetical protein OXX80_011137 [Metschnikowia pulcherrima]